MQEGELRPQLLDRFGLSVQVVTLPDIKQRTTLVLDRLLFEQVGCLLMVFIQISSLSQNSIC